MWLTSAGGGVIHWVRASGRLNAVAIRQKRDVFNINMFLRMVEMNENNMKPLHSSMWSFEKHSKMQWLKDALASGVYEARSGVIAESIIETMKRHVPHMIEECELV